MTPVITENPSQGLITGVNDTGDKFVAEQLIVVSLTPPVINIPSLISPQIFKKMQNGPSGILGGPGDTDS
jgi:hypothetical protein